MAANDYYNSFGPPQSPAPPPSSSKPSPNYPQSPYAAQVYSGAPPYGESPHGQGYLGSQSTLRPEPTKYSTSSLGRTDDHDQYADNIPLKSNMKMSADSHDVFPHQSTQYNHAAMESQIPPSPAEKPKKGFFKGRVPWVVYFLTLVQCSVFIGEFVKSSALTGSPIQTKPSFNYMIGPSVNVLINMGARYVPCMRTIDAIQSSAVPIQWPCPGTTTNDPNAASNQCTLSQVCGFGGVNEDQPNQWFRFITPMFLHAGIIHLAINMLMQCTMGREMEKQIGSLRFVLVYLSSGIFGFVLGGNFAAQGVASTGASGALFGVLGLFLLDLFYTWRERKNPVRDLMLSLVDVVIALVIGLLPFGVVDNFSHMGGLLMGIVLGICILHSPNALRERIGESSTPYQVVGQPTGVQAFAKKPVGFFKGRKPLWWAWWLLRAGALVTVLVVFIVLLNNFFKYKNTCTWCKYLSCLVSCLY